MLWVVASLTTYGINLASAWDAAKPDLVSYRSVGPKVRSKFTRTTEPTHLKSGIRRTVGVILCFDLSGPQILICDCGFRGMGRIGWLHVLLIVLHDPRVGACEGICSETARG